MLSTRIKLWWSHAWVNFSRRNIMNKFKIFFHLRLQSKDISPLKNSRKTTQSMSKLWISTSNRALKNLLRAGKQFSLRTAKCAQMKSLSVKVRSLMNWKSRQTRQCNSTLISATFRTLRLLCAQLRLIFRLVETMKTLWCS